MYGRKRNATFLAGLTKDLIPITIRTESARSFNQKNRVLWKLTLFKDSSYDSTLTIDVIDSL
jgi:hypothetical protein